MGYFMSYSTMFYRMVAGQNLLDFGQLLTQEPLLSLHRLQLCLHGTKQRECMGRNHEQRHLSIDVLEAAPRLATQALLVTTIKGIPYNGKEGVTSDGRTAQLQVAQTLIRQAGMELERDARAVSKAGGGAAVMFGRARNVASDVAKPATELDLSAGGSGPCRLARVGGTP